MGNKQNKQNTQNKNAFSASLPKPVVSSRMFTDNDVKVVSRILGPGREFTAQRMLEEAEKRLVQKAPRSMSGGWIHHDWMAAGLKIEEVPSEQLEAAVKAAKDTSSQVLSVEPPPPVIEEKKEEEMKPVVVIIESQPSVTCKTEPPNVEVCVEEKESAILYIKQPTSSVFKPGSVVGSSQGSELISDSDVESSNFGSESMDPESLEEEVDGGFMRMANEDD